MIRAAILGVLLAVTACNVNEYCLNCAKAGDGGVGDAQDGGDGGGPTDDAPDASPCMPTGPEVCDNTDNDCDGMTDEGPLPTVGDPCTSAPALNSGLGECTGGVKQCTAGAIVCSKPAKPEQCDGLDNNCDGTVDDGDPGGGATCGTNVGECTAGTLHCNLATHAVECQGAIGSVNGPGQDEVCDNQDNDCDGIFDEGLSNLGACGGGPGADPNAGICQQGTLTCMFGTPICLGAVSPQFEVCDLNGGVELDQDCDGQPHNGYNTDTDPQNCGMCGNVCDLPHAFESCTNGQCTIAACENGFHNNNNVTSDGCESGFCVITGAEVCNGADDDCSGTPDDNLGAPPAICQSGGECGMTAPTAQCMGNAGWRCTYPGMVSVDGNGAITPETRCDGLDNDCDGRIDEGQPNLGDACTDTGVGACQGSGAFQCDPADLDGPAVCVITAPGQTASAELCDGKDNNCDGIVDNTTGPSRVIDAMTHVQVGMLDYYIDTYEASHPDASATSSGVGTTRACSNANVLPWKSVSYTTAKAACQAAGKDLCLPAQWKTACKGAMGFSYPYGNTFQPNACNTESFDGVPGGADNDVLLRTGAMASCTSGPGVRDLSGNLREWTDEITGTTPPPGSVNIAVLRGGGYTTPSGGATCDFDFSRAAVNVIEDINGFRCCRSTAP